MYLSWVIGTFVGAVCASFLPEIAGEIESLDNIISVIPRLESFALASTGEQTKGILVVGIDPEKELELTHPDKKLSEGEYFNGSSG